VLASIAGILARNNVSISSMIQEGDESAGAVPLIFITHKAREMSVSKAVDEIKKLPEVEELCNIIRVEN
jgi:homoserine dehydrogenase